MSQVCRGEFNRMSGEPNFFSEDGLIASSAKFLIEGGDDEAASVILASNTDAIRVTWTDHYNGVFTYGIEVDLRGPRPALDLLNDRETVVYQQVSNTVAAVLEHNCSLGNVNVRADLMSIAPEWRGELVGMARGVLVHNQAATAEKVRLWQNLRFRSQSEIRIAQALDKTGAVFFPNCMA